MTNIYFSGGGSTKQFALALFWYAIGFEQEGTRLAGGNLVEPPWFAGSRLGPRATCSVLDTHMMSLSLNPSKSLSLPSSPFLYDCRVQRQSWCVCTMAEQHVRGLCKRCICRLTYGKHVQRPMGRGGSSSGLCRYATWQVVACEECMPLGQGGIHGKGMGE